MHIGINWPGADVASAVYHVVVHAVVQKAVHLHHILLAQDGVWRSMDTHTCLYAHSDGGWERMSLNNPKLWMRIQKRWNDNNSRNSLSNSFDGVSPRLGKRAVLLSDDAYLLQSFQDLSQ